MLKFIKMGLLSLAISAAKDYKTTKLCWEEIDKMLDERKNDYILKYEI